MRRILAGADELCAPGPLALRHARGKSGIDCESMFLKTSFPPKRQLSFTLDSTRYIATLVVTNDHPRLMPALASPAQAPVQNPLAIASPR